MSAALPRKHGKPYSSYAVAVRQSPTGPHSRGGYLYCDGCGASTVTLADFCRAIGVNGYQLRKYLDRQPMRQDIADKIRANLFREEGPR
jgi:hypothetical protein